MEDNHNKQNNSDQFVAPLTKIYRNKQKNKNKTPVAQGEQVKNQDRESFSDQNNGSKMLQQNIDYSKVQGLKQGFIKKWVNIVRGFKKRWFVLTDELLIYYKEKKGQVSEKGQISLRLAKIDPRSMNDKRMIIGTGTGEIHLEFQTIQEKREWLQAIDECKRKLHFQQISQSQHVSDQPGQNVNDHFEFEETKSNERRSKNSPQIGGNNNIQSEKELQDALSMALQTNMLKEDSQLAVNLAETWKAQANFEEALNLFKQQLIKSNIPSSLVRIGEQLEQSSIELKQSVTNAIKTIEQTKIEIIKVLQQQEQKFLDQLKDDKGMMNDDKFRSFSQEFNERIEQRSNSKRYSKFSHGGSITQSNDDDEFYDAKGDEVTLKNIQQEIIKLNEEEQQFVTGRQSIPEQKDDEEMEYRTILPALKNPDQKVSVWKVIKDAVGKDLSKFCVPVYFNEPISMLQKVSEIMEYESLLVKANDDKDPLKRLLYVTALSIAQYKCSEKRLNKPFNPILGETFELKRPNYHYFAEQVSHHPPISACYAQSDHYEFWMNTNMKTTFWGKSLEIKPMGYQHVRLKSTGEHFVIERPSSTVNNLIFGEMYVEHVGVSTVKNLNTGDICQIEYKKRGWSGKNAGEVEGYAMHASSKDKKFRIFGKWFESLSIKNMITNEEEQIWTCNPYPPNSEQMYNFTFFTLQLNFLPPSLKERLPPTDSRLRPDQRYLEEGDLVRAAEEKGRLEDKQRTLRKEKEAKGIHYQSKYFEEYFDEESKEKGYKMVRDYWADRKKGDWSHLENLF